MPSPSPDSTIIRKPRDTRKGAAAARRCARRGAIDCPRIGRRRPRPPLLARGQGRLLPRRQICGRRRRRCLPRIAGSEATGPRARTRASARARAHTHTHTHRHRHTQTQTHTHTDTHRHRHTQTHTYTHTHTDDINEMPFAICADSRVVKGISSMLSRLVKGISFMSSHTLTRARARKHAHMHARARTHARKCARAGTRAYRRASDLQPPPAQAVLAASLLLCDYPKNHTNPSLNQRLVKNECCIGSFIACSFPACARAISAFRSRSTTASLGVHAWPKISTSPLSA